MTKWGNTVNKKTCKIPHTGKTMVKAGGGPTWSIETNPLNFKRRESADVAKIERTRPPDRAPRAAIRPIKRFCFFACGERQAEWRVQVKPKCKHRVERWVCLGLSQYNLFGWLSKDTRRKTSFFLFSFGAGAITRHTHTHTHYRMGG